MCRTTTPAMRSSLAPNKPEQGVVKGPFSNSKKRQRKAVRFANTVMISLKPVCQQELTDTWYAPLEYRHFQRQSKVSLKAVTQNLCGDIHAYDASQHCLRGLESCLSPQVYQSRKEEKITVVAQVLRQQLLNRLVGIDNPEHLASISKGISRQAQERALLLAAFDCKEHLQHQHE